MSSCRCPVCGRPQRFLDDEWPDICACGYEWDGSVKKSYNRNVKKAQNEEKT